jgi:FkbM family methyltransferase
MRAELLWSPWLAFERLAAHLVKRRRLGVLRNTPARGLALGHIESLELLQLAEPLGIRVIYDIGAHVGTWTLLAKSILPAAKVEAFEPLEAHCRAFEGAAADLSEVTLHRVALGRTNSSAPLRIASPSDASSFLPIAETGARLGGLKEVDSVRSTVRRLDDFRRQHDIAPPDLLKLDVQGFELEVLLGAEECLAQAKALIVEVSFLEFYQGQCLFSEVCAFLHQRGFELRALGASTLLGRPLTQADGLFGRL